MAILLRADGSSLAITGPLTLEHMQRLVGGYVEMVRIGAAGELLIVDEDGREKSKPINRAATALYQGSPPRHDGIIVGDAIQCVCSNMGLDDEAYT
jgi:hypothetical protein